MPSCTTVITGYLQLAPDTFSWPLMQIHFPFPSALCSWRLELGPAEMGALAMFGQWGTRGAVAEDWSEWGTYLSMFLSVELPPGWVCPVGGRYPSCPAALSTQLSPQVSVTFPVPGPSMCFNKIIAKVGTAYPVHSNLWGTALLLVVSLCPPTPYKQPTKLFSNFPI